MQYGTQGATRQNHKWSVDIPDHMDGESHAKDNGIARILNGSLPQNDTSSADQTNGGSIDAL
jgi:hypothetical protein